MKSFWKNVLLTTLIAGTADITYAYINQYIKTGKFAEKMFQYIAGGALGLKKSIPGGIGVQFLGLFFHYFIAFSFTLLFFLAYRALNFQKLKFHWFLLIAILYGPFVNLFMRFIVLPLTLLPGPKTFDIKKVAIDWLFFTIVFALPIAFMTRRYYKLRQTRLTES